MLKKISLCLLALVFIGAGINHFLSPDMYRRIMPPYLPWHDALIGISGVFEVLLGALVLFPRTRRLAAYGLILLLIAVFPANLYMAQASTELGNGDPWFTLIAWARLPFQLVLILWAWWHRK